MISGLLGYFVTDRMDIIFLGLFVWGCIFKFLFINFFRNWGVGYIIYWVFFG